MLGSQAILEREHAAATEVCDRLRDGGVGIEVARHQAAAMQVQDAGSRRAGRLGRCVESGGEGSRGAGQRALFVCDARDRACELHELRELCAPLGDADLGRGGGVPRRQYLQESLDPGIERHRRSGL